MNDDLQTLATDPTRRRLLAGSALAGASLALPGALVAVLVLRLSWRRCVVDLPLSVEPDELAIDLDWLGLLGGLGLGLTLISVLVTRNVTDPTSAWVLVLALLALEVVLDRAWSRSPLATEPAAE